MRNRFVFPVALVAACLIPAAVASAQSPHFIGTPTCSKSLSSGLTCSGKAAGLGNGPTEALPHRRSGKRDV